MHYVLLQSFGPRAHVLEKCSANDNEVLTFFKDRLEGRVVKIDATYACRAFPEDSLPQIGAAMQSFQLLASLEGQEGFANVVFKGGDLTALYAIPENTEDSSLPNEYRTLSNELNRNRNRIERFAYRRCHLQPQILLWCL